MHGGNAPWSTTSKYGYKSAGEAAYVSIAEKNFVRVRRAAAAYVT
jgi:hypothetical protein